MPFKVDSNALGIESFTFGGVHSDDLNIIMEKKDIQFPEIREKTVELPNRPGVINLGHINPLARFGTRKIVVTCGLIADTRADVEIVKRALFAQLSLLGESKLTFSYTPDRCFYAQISDVSTELVNDSPSQTIVKVELTFTCSSPFAYASDDPTEIDITTPVVNDGDLPAEAVYTLNIAENVNSATFTMGSSKIVLDTPLKIGDVIQIGNSQIIRNGSEFLIPNLKQSVNFLEPPVGTNTFVSSVACTGTIKYRRRYMGA